MSNSVAYEMGRVFGMLVFVAVIVGAVWLVVHLARRSSNPRPGPRRDMATDLALLARAATLHASPEQAGALVAHVLAAGPFMTVAAEHPTWRFTGAHVLVRLTPTPAGSVLAVHELEVPLVSPEGAIAWEWATAQVEQAAAGAGVAVSRSTQAFVVSQQLDATRVIWTAAA